MFLLVSLICHSQLESHHNRSLGLLGVPKVALDHDFHTAGAVPSVCFLIDIPEDSKDSFHDGSLHQGVKPPTSSHFSYFFLILIEIPTFSYLFGIFAGFKVDAGHQVSYFFTFSPLLSPIFD